MAYIIPLSDKYDSFIPSETFDGSREGYVYTMGASGLGYYLNRPPVPEPIEFPTPSVERPFDPNDPFIGATLRHIPRSEIPSKYHPYLTFVELPKLPDREPPTDTLAIYMGCHAVRTSEIQPNIKGVTISKFNHASYCGTNVGLLIKSRTISSARNLVYGWEYLPRPTQEEMLTSDACNKVPMDGLDMESICPNFYVNPPNGWACKLYTAEKDPQACLALAYKDKVIDLLRCSVDELVDFIGVKGKLDEYIDVDPSTTIQELIRDYVINDVPNERKVSTIHLFNLIGLMRGITKVHIYDPSCNENDYTKQAEGTGYGGKSKRRKSKRRKSRKHCK